MKWLLSITLTLAFIWIACGASVDGRELAAAQTQWANSGLNSYSFVYSQSCECDDLTSGHKRVRVVDGVAVSVTFLGGAQEQSLDPVTYGYTIEELFEIIDTQLAEGVSNEIEYSEVGYPSLMLLDLEAMAVDGGFGLTIHSFEPA